MTEITVEEIENIIESYVEEEDGEIWGTYEAAQVIIDLIKDKERINFCYKNRGK